MQGFLHSYLYVFSYLGNSLYPTGGNPITIYITQQDEHKSDII